MTDTSDEQEELPRRRSRRGTPWSTLLATMLDLRIQLVHLLAFSLAINLLVLVVPVFMIQVFDRVLSSHNVETLGVLAAGAIAALLVMGLLDLVRGRILSRAGAQLERNLTPELLASGADARLGDVGRLRTFLSGPMMASALDAPWIPVFLIVVFLLHPMLGWITLAGTVILAAMAFASERLTRAHQIEIQRAERALAAVAQQFRDPDGSIRAMGLRSPLRKRWMAAHDLLAAKRLRLGDRNHNAAVTGRVLRLVLQIALMTAAAALVIAGQITPGAMVAASVIAARALGPVERAQETWRAMVQARAAIARLARTELNPPPVRSFAPRTGRPELDVRNVALEDSHSRQRIFSNVSFRVIGGELFGITGPSGSGKSAFAKLLVGLETPSAGKISLDRHNIAYLTLEEAQDDIAYLPQKPELLRGTIADNISRFGDAELPEIDTAARLAGIENAILDLPHGYATEVGPGTSDLPQGIRQGIMLARTFFANPRLIVMDEPYTYLDNNGIQHLLAALQHFREMGSAVVVVSQRPSVLAHCDRVLVLDGANSRIVGRRKKTELRVLESDADDAIATDKDTVKRLTNTGD